MGSNTKVKEEQAVIQEFEEESVFEFGDPFSDDNIQLPEIAPAKTEKE